MALVVKDPPANPEAQEMQVQSLGRGDPLEEGTVFLPGESPRTEELVGLWSIELQRVGHD